MSSKLASLLTFAQQIEEEAWAPKVADCVQPLKYTYAMYHWSCDSAQLCMEARRGNHKTCSAMCRAPEAMQKPDAEWLERCEDLLQYQDKIFRDRYPKAMLIA